MMARPPVTPSTTTPSTPAPNGAAPGGSAGAGGRPAGRPPRPSYSRFVRMMKVMLPGTALLLVALVVAWPQLDAVEEEVRVKFAALKETAVDRIEMVNARFFGTDDDNRPFAVTAMRAVEMDTRGDLVELDLPKADMSLDNETWVMLNGDKGYYSKSSGTLTLKGNVNLFHDRGYEFHTSEAVIDVNAGAAQGDEPVQGSGSFGHVTGEGFTLSDQGARITVTGKSRLVLTPRAGGTL